MSTKTFNIFETVQEGSRLLSRTNRKSHTRFRFVPKSMTLDTLNGRNALLQEKRFTEPTRKNEWTHTLSGKM